MIYLDYTAHVPPSAEAMRVFLESEQACIGNANAHHPAGETAKAWMDDAQTTCAKLLCISPRELIFTSGASEGNNTAINGLVYSARHFGHHIITSPLEHPSVSGCLTALQERGYEIDVLPIGPDGRIRTEDVSARLRQDTVLVTLPAVDSELGVIQPMEEIAAIVRTMPHCHLHVDATQAIGKIPIDLSLADTAVFSAHKFGGFTGSGLLYKKDDIEMEPLIHGGVSTSIYRSGTPAVGLAASLATALDAALSHMPEHTERIADLNRMLREALCARGVRIFSPEHAIPHILNIGVDGIKGAAMRDALAAHDVCVSVKSACSVENTPSRAVYAITKSRRQALEAFRVSLSSMTTEDEIAHFLDIFDIVLKELKP